MKVWLDGLPLLTSHRGGVGNYCYCLLRELNKLPDIDVGAFYNKSKLRWAPVIEGAVYSSRFPYRGLQRIGEWGLVDKFPLEWIGLKGDIYHGTDASLLPSKHMKKVITIHDLEILSNPQTINPQDRIKRFAALQYALKQTDAVITVSEYTKQDVLTHFPNLRVPIFAIPLAAESIYEPCFSEDKVKGVREKYGLPQKFILYVGGNYPRKNLEGMLRAFAKAKKMGIQEKFVLAGGSLKGNKGIYEVLNAEGIQDDVIFAGFVEAVDLPLVYQMAVLFMHVSFFEGFGLPVLEAMQCGTPAMVSDRASLPEVVGECGVIVKPDDIEGMGAQLTSLLSNKQCLESLSISSRQRAGKFSWRKTAEKTLDVYNFLLR